MGILDEVYGFVESAVNGADDLVDDVVDGVGYYGDKVTGGKASDLIEGIEYYGGETQAFVEDPKEWWEKNIVDYFKEGNDIPPFVPALASVDAFGRLAPSDDNEMVTGSREEFTRALMAAGLNPAAATAAGSRFENRGFLQLGESAGALNNSLASLLNSFESQAAGIQDRSNLEFFFYGALES